ncbi:DNA polymerase III subunit beta [Spirosoma utsteinense]|uniref:DNA polymerase III subunit beta n=1 Tax=Spirosoma utsteinense TaxID=2585773 RepID=UPI0016456455|nr:DNA polymerase III subunit beta [Spirosoma utsteinense]MBC3785743.1 DNA polymerase-3 subunit beta [Spirosoma utsteinense]
MDKKSTAPTGPKVIFASSQLKKALSFIAGSIAGNPIVPVLENVRFVAQDGRVTLTGSDLQTTLRVTLDAECLGMPADGITFLLPFQLFNSLVRKIADQTVVITIGTDAEAFGHVITCTGGSYNLAGENPIDYPKSKTPKGDKPVDLALEGDLLNDFMAGLSLCATATSKDDLRPAFTGISLKTRPGGLVMAASDGHRLYRYQISSAEYDPIEVIIPGKATRHLLNLTKLVSGEMKLVLTQSMLSASIGDYVVEGRLIDERYADYENAIPTNNPLEMKADVQALIGALGRIMLVANRSTHQVRLSLSVDGLTVSAQDLDYSNEGIETLDCEYEGDSFEIGFNAKNFLETLGHVEGDTVRFELSQPNRAAVVFGSDANALMLVMPVILNTYA